jgi:hypothetical protein
MIGNRKAAMMGIAGVVTMVIASLLGMISNADYWTNMILLGIFMREK